MRTSIRSAVIAAALILTPLLGLVVPGLASSLDHSSGSLAAEGAAVGRCDPDGVTTRFVLSGTDIQSVVVSGIDSGCGGDTIAVTVDNGSTARSGSSTVPGGGGSVSVSLSSTLPMSDAMQTETSL